MLRLKLLSLFGGKQNGFTVIELLVTMALAGILLMVAVPGFQSMIQNSRLTTQAGEFMSALYLARSEAIKRGVRVTLCKSSNIESKSMSCTKDGDWSQGWIVFVENSGSENAALDSGETVLRLRGSLEGGNVLRGYGNVEDYISYVANGFSRTVTNSVQTGDLVLCDSRNDPDRSRAIIINATGHPQLTSVAIAKLKCP